METEEYAAFIKSKSKKIHDSVHKQCLVHMLYKSGFQPYVIGNAIGKTKSNVNYMIRKFRDLLEVKDTYAVEAYNEYTRHKITIEPSFIECDGRMVEKYTLIIDNKNNRQ